MTFSQSMGVNFIRVVKLIFPSFELHCRENMVPQNCCLACKGKKVALQAEKFKNLVFPSAKKYLGKWCFCDNFSSFSAN